MNMSKKIKFIVILVIFGISLGCAGCGPYWQKKFIRKKKEVPKKATVIQMVPYEKPANLELYKKHYLYWKTMHSDLAGRFGRNLKGDLYTLGVLEENLSDMSRLLVDEKGKELQRYINQIDEIIVKIKGQAVSENVYNRIKDDLARHYRAIMRDFAPKKVTDFMRPATGVPKVEEQSDKFEEAVK